MASIEKRQSADGATSYRVKVRIKGFPTETATFDRLTDARRWVQHTESAMREGRHFKNAQAKRRTVADLVDRYQREVMPTKSASSQKAQAVHLAWWKANLGHYVLADVTPALLSEYRDRLLTEPSKPKSAGSEPQRRGNSTVVRYMAALSHALTIASREWGWIDDNAFRRVRKPKEPAGRVRFLSPDELARFLAACKASDRPELYPAAMVAVSTGARSAEVMTLRWRQVDLVRRVIYLEQTKNGERRTLPLAGPALEAITALSKVRRIDTDLLFPSTKHADKPLELRAAFLKAIAQAGITDFRWHDLRHTAASYLAMNGASLIEIAEIVGHKTLQMVKRYAHLSTDHTSSVVTRMNKAVFGGE